jgi:hypothetical protein
MLPPPAQEFPGSQSALAQMADMQQAAELQQQQQAWSAAAVSGGLSNMQVCVLPTNIHPVLTALGVLTVLVTSDVICASSPQPGSMFRLRFG